MRCARKWRGSNGGVHSTEWWLTLRALVLPNADRPDAWVSEPAARSPPLLNGYEYVAVLVPEPAVPAPQSPEQREKLPLSALSHYGYMYISTCSSSKLPGFSAAKARQVSVGLCCSPHANVKTPSLISRSPRGRNKRGGKAPKSKSFVGPGHGIIQISPCYRRFQNPAECLRRQKLRSRDPCKPLLRESAQVVNWNSPASETKTTQAVSDPIPTAKKKKIEIMAIHLGLLNNLGTGGGTDS